MIVFIMKLTKFELLILVGIIPYIIVVLVEIPLLLINAETSTTGSQAAFTNIVIPTVIWTSIGWVILIWVLGLYWFLHEQKNIKNNKVKSS